MNRNAQETLEAKLLAPYALKNIDSKGRNTIEAQDEYRLDFARDRDRIIHTKAFRRLKGKTQVFVTGFGDHYRSRLTHSLEVSQIARTLARIFQANEDMAEAVALAHDLGHTPFGHAGQELLAKKLKNYGEHFEHNAQSRRILESIEPKNLCIETLQCLCKHPTEKEKENYHLSPQNFLEGQIVDIADAIAYTAADLQDGIASGLLLPNEWNEIPENFINEMVRDIAEYCFPQLQTFSSPEEIRTHHSPLISFSPHFLPIFQKTKEKLMQKLYRHPQVQSQTKRGTKILSDLFDYFIAYPEDLPETFENKEPTIIRIKDFLAGMTDGFAEENWEKFCKNN